MKNLFKNKTSYVLIVVSTVLLLIAVSQSSRAGGNGNHEHHDSMMNSGSKKPHNDEKQNSALEHHRHATWEKPPADYMSLKSDRWEDKSAGRRGAKLFQQQCVSCHGDNGKGDGMLASSLSHAPADLTNHFHKKPGDGDAYLYWRISEGGQVEPFRSMKSAMPAFKHILSEEDRWDVLVYVHQQFHKDFLVMGPN